VEGNEIDSLLGPEATLEILQKMLIYKIKTYGLS
jgi:hypothetical protein